MLKSFNPNDALLFSEPEFPPFEVRELIPLHQALSEKHVKPDSPLLLAHLGSETLVLPMLAMVYHHVAQGRLGNFAWVASFCALCNAGSIFNAEFEGQIHHFAAQGYYDAMTLLADQQSQSYWNHLTGISLFGKHAGKKLEHRASLLQMSAADILNAYPDAQFAVDNLNAAELAEAAEWDVNERLVKTPGWEGDEQILKSLSREDKRLPRHEMGLGIWTAKTRRYYPIHQIYQKGNLLFDKLEGRTILVYIDPHVGLPMACFCESTHAEWHGDEIHFSGGKIIRKAVLYHHGKALSLERPNQNVIRWHGFSALFPDCEIYGLA